MCLCSKFEARGMTLKVPYVRIRYSVFAIRWILHYNGTVVIVFLFCLALNIFAAVDQDSYEWRFLRNNAIRQVDSRMDDGCGGTVDITCYHRNDYGYAEVFGPLWRIVFSVSYETVVTRPSRIERVYNDGTNADKHFFITSSASSFVSTSGSVVMLPPDAEPVVWTPELFSGGSMSRPEFVWMCRGDVMGVEFKRFVFQCSAETKACVGVKVIYADLPKATVSWGEADADGDYVGEPQSRICDLMGAIVKPYP